jgi:hypothetical protein
VAIGGLLVILFLAVLLFNVIFGSDLWTDPKSGWEWFWNILLIAVIIGAIVWIWRRLYNGWFRALLLIVGLLAVGWLIVWLIGGFTMTVGAELERGVNQGTEQAKEVGEDAANKIECVATHDTDGDKNPDATDLNDDGDDKWDWNEARDQGGDPCFNEWLNPMPEGFPADAVPSADAADTTPAPDGRSSPSPRDQSPTTSGQPSTPTANPSTPTPTPSGTASCNTVPTEPDKSLQVLVDPNTNGTPDQLRLLKENGADTVIMDQDPGDPGAWLTDAQCIGLLGGASYDGAFESGDDAATQFAQAISGHANYKYGLINFNLAQVNGEANIGEANRRIELLKSATGGKTVCIQVNLDYRGKAQVKYLNEFETECVIVGLFPFSNFPGSTMEALEKVAGPVNEANPSSEVTVGVQAFENSGEKPSPEQVGEMVDKLQSGGDVDNVLLITEGSNTIDNLPEAVKRANTALAA